MFTTSIGRGRNGYSLTIRTVLGVIWSMYDIGLEVPDIVFDFEGSLYLLKSVDPDHIALETESGSGRNFRRKVPVSTYGIDEILTTRHYRELGKMVLLVVVDCGLQKEPKRVVEGIPFDIGGLREHTRSKSVRREHWQ